MAVDDRLRDDALRARQRRRPLGSGDAIHAEHPVVPSQVAPGGEVGAVGPDHDVLRLDLALGLDAADVDVADAQHLVVAHGSPDGLGDLGVGVGRRLDEEPDLLGGRARLLQSPLGHRGHDLLQGAAGVTREEHVLAAAQRHGDGRRLAWREVERRQAHRAVERVTPGAPLLRRERDAGLPQRAQVALDGPDADLEVLGQPPRRAPPWPRRTQLLDQGVQAVDAVHARERRRGRGQD